MRYGVGNPLYGPEILEKMQGLYNDPDFVYLTKRGVGRKIGISQKTMYEWIKEKPEFKAAVDLILADVEDEFQELVTKRSMSGEKMSAAWLIYRTANVFGWRNTVEATVNSQQVRDALDDEVKKQLAEAQTTDGK
ncbi:MAG: phBC6A51 family helix-turn-helix protein [Pseudomonadota bacterium]